jgi:hypothetical protein
VIIFWSEDEICPSAARARGKGSIKDNRIAPSEGEGLAMKRLLGALLLLSSLAWAADFKLAKVLEVRDASSLAEAAVANHPVAIRAGGEQTASVPSQYLRCEITVALEGTSYTAVYPVDKHFKTSDYSVGDMVPARIDGKKLVLKRLDGKEMKAKIVRQGPLEPAPPGL